jgi:CRISPR-associated protein Csd1
MILSRLNDLYYRLLENPDSNSGLAKVPPYGFTDENISYCLVLSTSGKLVDIQDIRDTSDKRPKPRRLSVPRPEKRTSGMKPNFLWDKTAYVLGVEGNKDKKAAKVTPWVIAEKNFTVFKKFHADLISVHDDIGLNAFRQFLLDWQPEWFRRAPFTAEHVDSNLVFKLDGDLEFIHERAAAKRLWLSLLSPIDSDHADPDSRSGFCLVKGEVTSLSRLHPSIKGVYGGQSSGGSIVSFNAEAYESFGKSQGDNAPVSEQAAFAYTTSLNFLLRRENGQCLSIGDTSTVYWAQARNAIEDQQALDFFSAFANPPTDESQSKKLAFSIENIANGRAFEEVG